MIFHSSCKRTDLYRVRKNQLCTFKDHDKSFTGPILKNYGLMASLKKRDKKLNAKVFIRLFSTELIYGDCSTKVQNKKTSICLGITVILMESTSIFTDLSPKDQPIS